MRNKTLNFIVLISFLFLGSFATAQELTTENRKLKKFDEIDLRIPADIIFVQGKKTKVEVKAESDKIGKVRTKISGHLLIIDCKGNGDYWFPEDNKPQIYITVKNLNRLRVSSFGSFTSDKKLKTKTLKITASGNSKVKIKNLEAKKLEVKSSGSSKLDLESKGVDDFVIKASGSSRINAFKLPSTEVSIQISGSANANILPQDALHVRVSGSSKVFYKGEPKVFSHITGSGKLIEMDND